MLLWKNGGLLYKFPSKNETFWLQNVSFSLGTCCTRVFRFFRLRRFIFGGNHQPINLYIQSEAPLHHHLFLLTVWSVDETALKVDRG